MTTPIRIAIQGASGRMGRAVQACAAAADDVRVLYLADRSLAAVDVPVRQGPDLLTLREGDVDGIIDFSSPGGTKGAAEAAGRMHIPLVSGTTGLDGDTKRMLRESSKVAPVCWAPNFSIGVPLLIGTIRNLARVLPPNWQIEIVETHHAGKRDAPSGTALRIAEAWGERRPGHLVHGRQGNPGPREGEEIGVHAIRLGDVVGEHRAIIGGLAEILEITHRVQDRAAFAMGCLEALRRIMRRGPGWYEWEDLLSRD